MQNKQSKRENAIQQYEEKMKAPLDRLNRSIERFRDHHDADDIASIIKDIEELESVALLCRTALVFMDTMDM
jgi:hypothetical protein